MRTWIGAALLAIEFTFAVGFALAGVPDGPPTIGAEPTEAERAAALFDQSNVIDSIPLYERLAANNPQSPVYAERLAFGLMLQVATMPDGEERTALFARAKSEAERAQALGDNSNLLKIVLDQVSGDLPPAYRADEAKLAAAEAAFVRGDLDTALAGYQEIAAADAHSYEARLYAGDVYFRKHELRQAGEWYQQAIQVDPNRETAYRYWGDALMTARNSDAALQQFMNAVVAEPYSQTAWMGLKQWADHTGAKLVVPRVPLPKVSDDPKRPSALAVDPDVPAGLVWGVYLSTRDDWRNKDFAKTFPEAKSYRHTLLEELVALESVLMVVDAMKLSDRETRQAVGDLAALKSDGMLEPFVLLHAADEGIASDYVAYREEHRDQVSAYLRKYVIKISDKRK